MARGRKPKSVEVKRAAGNPGCRKLGEEPEVAAPRSLDPPVDLRPRARAVWDRITGRLRDWGMLDEADLHLLAGFANQMARHLEAEEYLAENGPVYETSTGYQRESPYVKISLQALNSARLLATNFGFDPTSRARLGAINVSDDDDPLDRLDDD